MRTIEARNAHEMFAKVMRQARDGVRELVDVLWYEETIGLTYLKPKERVSFWGECDPFHEMGELVRGLARYDDLELVAARLTSTGHGEMLAPAILDAGCPQKWEPSPMGHVYFRTRADHVDALMCSNVATASRSPVMLSGALELIAHIMGAKVGTLEHVVGRLYIRPEHVPLIEQFRLTGPYFEDPYDDGAVADPLVAGDLGPFKLSIELLAATAQADQTPLGNRDRFVRKVAGPMLSSRRAFQEAEQSRRPFERFDKGRWGLKGMVPATDWRQAGEAWLAAQEGTAQEAEPAR